MTDVRTKSIIKIAIGAILILISLWIASSKIVGKKIYPSYIKDFEISVTKTSDGLLLKNIKGSQWLDLKITLLKEMPKTIDTYGKVKPNEIRYGRNPEEPYYCISFKKTYYGNIRVFGIEGTYWNELYFSLDDGETKRINREGLMKD